MSIPSPLTVARTVAATLLARREVRWPPGGPGPFPAFHGELLAKAANGEGSFRLVPEGTYAPHVGFIDERFDASVGRSVAQSTTRELLGRIKGAIEDAARGDEEAHTRRNVS